MNNKNAIPIEEQTVLITGASRGIGRATALAFADKGASVVINYHSSSDTAESTAKEARKLLPDDLKNEQKIITAQADVSKETEVESMFDSITNEIGYVDTLINNAGVLFESELTDTSVRDWDRTMEVNLRGCFLCAKQVLPAMQQRGHGIIINTASNWGHVGETGYTHYAASKAGIIGFTRTLAREVSPTVRVNAIAPGPVITDMLPEGDKDPDIPLERAAEPEEIALSYLYLAGLGGAFYTGQVLDPNGGEHMY